MIEKIVSGGQTGADRGGLDAAIYAKVPHGGWCPKGRLAEDGTIPAKYKLTEMKSKDYIKRTEANVVDSDATVIFSYGKPTGGTKRTVEFCEAHAKPYCRIDFRVHSEDAAIDYIAAWLTALSDSDHSVNSVKKEASSPQRSQRLCASSNSDHSVNSVKKETLVLNVAGSRESKSPGLAEKVMRVIVNVLHEVNGKGPIMYTQADEYRGSN